VHLLQYLDNNAGESPDLQNQTSGKAAVRFHCLAELLKNLPHTFRPDLSQAFSQQPASNPLAPVIRMNSKSPDMTFILDNPNHHCRRHAIAAGFV
jgi:hypothetical protein